MLGCRRASLAESSGIDASRKFVSSCMQQVLLSRNKDMLKIDSLYFLVLVITTWPHIAPMEAPTTDAQAQGSNCFAGRHCPADSSTAVSCPPGTYMNLTEALQPSDCATCPGGFYCTGGANLRPNGLCSAGYYCPPGSSTDAPPGHVCMPGYYCQGGAELPTACANGTYQDKAAQESCKTCPQGFYCNTSSALLCPARFYCPGGTAYPVPCPSGYYCNGYGADPEQCLAGYYCPSGSYVPVPCPDGTYSTWTNLSSSSQCFNCPQDSYCPLGSRFPQSCPNETTAVCQPCPSGYYCNLGGQQAYIDACPDGHYLDFCPTRFWHNVPCSAGTYNLSSGVSWWCASCSAGRGCDCRPGTYCPVGWFSLVECPAGYYCPKNASYAIACPVGTYSPYLGRGLVSDCMPCPNGTYCTSEGLTEPSEVPTRSSARSTRFGIVISICQACDSSEATATTLSQTFKGNRLKDISLINITAGNANELAEKVQAKTVDADSLTLSEVIDSTTMVNKLAVFISSANFTADLYPVPGYIGKIVGNLMNVNDTVLAYAQSESNVSIQASLENSLYALAEAATQNGVSVDERFLRLQEDNLAFQVVRNFSVYGLTISQTRNLSQASITPVLISDTSNFTSTAVDDATVVKLSQLAANSTKTFLIYNNAKLFQTSASVKADSNSRVLSVQLPKSSSRKLPGLISILFTGLTAPPNGTTRQCGYWDYAAVKWSSEGCNAVMKGDDHIECECDHLTNFAALLAVNDIASNQALDILSTVGLSLSVLALAAVVITFAFIRKMRRTVSQKVLFNLALSLLLLDVLFLLGIDSTHSTGGCIAVAALLHYFLLTSFIWMLVESILQYLRFVKVLGTYIPRFMLKTAIPAWGAPAIVVAIVFGINSNLYYRGNNSYCLAQQEVVYYAVLLPIGLILLVNWIIFAIVLKHFCCRSRRFAYQSKDSESRLAQLHAQAGIAICSLLGLTWVFGFLTAIPDATTGLAFQWLFCICNTLQGFMIFVFHCVREPAVLKEMKRFCCTTDSSTHKITMSSTSEDSTAVSRSKSSSRSQTYSESSDSVRSIPFGRLVPSHQGSYELSSISNPR